MMAQRSLKERPLHELLEGLLISHRQDIKAFSGGHLNEANLPKPPDKASHKSWRSAKKPHIHMVARSQLSKCTGQTQEQNNMADTIMQFSVGTSSKPPVRHDRQVSTEKRAMQASRHPLRVQRQHSANSQGSYSKRDDGVLVEEIKMPQNTNYRPKACGEEDLKDCGKAEAGLWDEHLCQLTQHAGPGMMQAVTKKDQFSLLKQYETNILRKQDSTEQNVLSGMKAVEELELRLHEELQAVDDGTGGGQGFHSLQAYSNCLDHLITQSPTFGYILKTIKMEYDDYVAVLLDSQMPKHQVLYEQVEKLSKRGTANPHRLRKQTSRVHDLEKEAKKLLQQNERLRKELATEVSRAAQPAAPEPLAPASNPYSREAAPELSRQIEHLHNTILSKVDELNELRTRLRKHYVPSTVCTHLEQCIKETEVEIQKLTSQKDYFEHSTADMENELQSAIEDADTTERDARRVWKRIAAVKSPNKKRRGSDDSGDESDSEIKWSWYIS